MSYLKNDSSEESTCEDAPEVNDLPASYVHSLYIALYSYQSEEPGDLSFQAGEVIVVTKEEAQWYTGHIGEKEGVFPFNYVESLINVAAEKQVFCRFLFC